MKIQYMSDLHLEYPENRQYFKNNPIRPVGDVLILAGDIINETIRQEAEEFFTDIEKKFPLIISTMGNHEFYGGEIAYAYPSYRKNLAENHLLLNNQTLIHNDVKFIVSALWSQVVPEHREEIGRRLNDYRYIKKRTDDGLININIDDTNYYHQLSKQFISEELQKDFPGKVVVITHHLPSLNCIDSKWRSSTLISAFANDMDELILNHKIDCWIFGHQHEQFSQKLGNTQMLSNPLGYSKEANFKIFNSTKSIEL